MIIKEVRSRIIKDSRGQDAICVSVNGCAEASSPNGKSTGKYETKSYYKSIKFCVGFLNGWNDLIEINKFDDLVKVEKTICKKLGLRNAREFGANSLYAFQSAVLKALAHDKKKELFEIVGNSRKMPFPVGNVVGGGLHSSAIKIHPNFQEFLVIPKSKTFSENLKIMNYVYNDQIKYIGELILNYNLGYVEDPFQEKDFKSFSELQKALGKKCMIVGDDLTATQYSRTVGAIRTGSINAMIIKPNQNGSLLELKRIFDLCRKHGVATVLSHRSGETLDNALADYAVVFGADYIKCGVAPKWREAKLERLAEIEKRIR